MKKNHNLLYRKSLITMLCIFGFSFSQQADAMRCGSKVIRTGDSVQKIRKNCGEPTAIERRIIYRTPFVNRSSALSTSGSSVSVGSDRSERKFSEEVAVETWTYNYGKKKLTRIIRLDDGVVVEIKTGGYGD